MDPRFARGPRSGGVGTRGRDMRRWTRTCLAVAVLSTALAIGGPPPAQATTDTCSISKPSAAFTQPVALSAGHARVWRLYQAFFLRQPEQAGMDYWIGIRARGASPSAIAFEFSSSKEFRDRYGNLDHGQFVDLVYENVLCRVPDSGGRAHWINALQSGTLTRWDMVINFVELREYLRRTSTCHSLYPAESAAVASCPVANLVPLAQADYATHGYQERYETVPRVGGGLGSFRGVDVDFSRNVFEAGANRCSVASINANWLEASQKDRPNPAVLGLGLVDGVHVKGSSDRTDRGVLGLRFDDTPTDVVEVWPGDTKSPDDRRLSSVLYHRGKATLESWHASAETSPYLNELHPEHKVGPDEWVWAAAGIPLRIDGQTDRDFMQSYVNDPYTYQTLGHPFVAFDQNTGRLVFAGASNLDVRDLVVWAENHGYEDLIKFDGGGSFEFNVGGKPAVGGTSRDVPVWLGVGC